MLEVIFWKPEFAWRVVAIEVLTEIKQFTMRRNETTDLASLADAAAGKRRVDTAANRVQRKTRSACARWPTGFTPTSI